MSRTGRRYPADAVGELFVCMIDRESRPLFRFTAVLAEPVDPEVLRVAFARTLARLAAGTLG